MPQFVIRMATITLTNAETKQPMRALVMAVQPMPNHAHLFLATIVRDDGQVFYDHVLTRPEFEAMQRPVNMIALREDTTLQGAPVDGARIIKGA